MRPGPKPQPLVHGTAVAYGKHKCRCDVCRAGNTRRKIQQYQDRRARVTADPSLVTHGTPNAANTWGCPCDQCRPIRAAIELAHANRRRGRGTDEPLTPMQRYKRIAPFGREWLDSVQ